MTLHPLHTVLVSSLVAAQLFTQSLAYQARYAPALGRPLTTVQVFQRSHGVYAPWQGAVWAWRWGQSAPDVLRMAGLLASLPLVLGGLLVRRQREGGTEAGPPPLTGHGTTRWATWRDICQAGLHTPTGIVLGKVRRPWGWGWHRLRFDGEENVLLVGPQRAGKGTGVIIPTLLDQRAGHLLIVDVRGETYTATAGSQARRGARVVRLSLTQPGSARFSLPQAIRRGTPHEFFDAASIAEMHIDAGGGKEDHDHWEKTSKSFLTCALLYEVHTRPMPTMSHVASFWSQPGQQARDLLGYVVRHAPTQPIAELGQEVLNKTEREASGVLSSMMKELFVYRDPTIAANTSTCDFRLEDFTRHTRWLSLYLVQSPGEEEHVRPFLRAFLRLALQRWLEIGDTTHQITLLLDEYVSFGHLPFMAHNLAVLGGRGIRTLLAVQNIPQLRIYGHPDVITEQCKVRVFFAANGQTTGQEISRQTGTGTATTMQESQRAEGWSWLIADSRTRQEQKHSRPLLTDAEAMQIPEDTAVIQYTGHPPIWAKKIRFWEHRDWKALSAKPAPLLRSRP
jgi:type IV secretion system protein VirD4